MDESVGTRLAGYSCRFPHALARGAFAGALACLLAGGCALSAQVTGAFYEGQVQTPTGQFVPFKLRIAKVGQDWSGSFILAKEAGPYDFNKVTYDPEARKLHFEYSSPDHVAMEATLIPMRLRHDRIKGDLTSSRGKLGTIEVTLSESVNFSIEPFFVGQWAGTCATKGKPHEVKLTLASDLQNDKAPPQSDLPWTPGKDGYFDEGNDMRFSVASFVPDYFASRIALDFRPLKSGSSSLEFVADVDYSKLSLTGKIGVLGTCKLDLQPVPRTLQ